MLIPWSAFWDRNYFVGWSPVIGALLTSNYVRGAVTGLGLVNVWAALAELADLFGSEARRRAGVTICLVTDRRRLGAAVGAGPADWAAALERQVTAAAAAGVDLVQVREADLEAAALVSLVERLVTATAGTPTRILVNDRLDVALAAGAAGVHLKERSFRPADVTAAGSRQSS